MRSPRIQVAAGAMSTLSVSEAAAHGLGQRYDLPLPLDLYMGAGAGVVALSFAVMALFARHPADIVVKNTAAAPGAPASDAPAATGHRALLAGAAIVRATALAFFVLVVLAGLLGDQDPFNNLAPVSVWVIGWVGIAFVSALIGDIWRVLNPFDTAFRCIESVVRRPPPWPGVADGWGKWPAVGLFVLFAWAELVWPARDQPAALATAMVAYAVLTGVAMACFGREAWLRSGEVFAVAFGLLARFAPTAATGDGRLRLRPLAGGLATREPVSWSLTVFALLMLATVSFDGILETPPWAGLAESALAAEGFAALAAALGLAPYPLLQTLGLAAAPLVFAGLYFVVAAGMAACARRAGARITVSETARLFVLTLVPIAVAYHLAHYLTYLLIAGQFMIPLISDPFGAGWDLFGTKLYFIDIGIIDARTAWYAALGLIIGGHVIAVWLAHWVAVRRFADRRAALASQVPMLILMVGYTAISLWILAQPITEVTGA